MSEVVFVKLGGSLITDKSRPGTDRPRVIERLAGEIGTLAEDRAQRLVIGHGSGSFGHVAARETGIHRGAASPEELAGVAETQARAAELHRRVVAALGAAGARPFSFAPSSAVVYSGGAPAEIHPEPLLLALELGLLPVTYGDVVLDRERGSAICSTEALFELLVAAVAGAGHAVREVLWLGETDGVWAADGKTVERITAATADPVLASAGGSAGTDVTGGMRLRLETALRLARRGVASRILDGRRAGALGAALAGEPAGGTRIEA